jgi:hypothetical protein
VSPLLLDVDLLAAGVGHLVALPRGVVAEGALAAAQVGHAHGAEQDPAKLLRRPGDGHADHVAEDVVLAEVIPKRLALAQQANVRLAVGGYGISPGLIVFSTPPMCTLESCGR